MEVIVSKPKFIKNYNGCDHYNVTLAYPDERGNKDTELRYVGENGWYLVTELQNYIRVDPQLEDVLNMYIKK